MASLAGRWRGLVEKHEVSVHRLLECVASRAGHVLMAALEGKCGLLVIEERGLPLVAIVATGAVVFPGAELVSVGVLVALRAGRRGTCKVNMYHR